MTSTDTGLLFLQVGTAVLALNQETTKGPKKIKNYARVLFLPVNFIEPQ